VPLSASYVLLTKSREIQIKHPLDKRTLEFPLENVIHQQQVANDFQIMPIERPPVLALNELPLHHKDPFDRLLITQANADGAFLVSNDSVFSQYQVNLLR
jgi:PIN domain nuclease of toxin-antitoxin system